MDDWEILNSAEAIFQTYEASGGRARHRTALILRQDPALPIEIEGKRPTYALFLVESRTEGEQPNSLLFSAHDELGPAIDQAVGWLGARRTVPAEKVPMTAVIGVANVLREPALLAKYAPRSQE